MSQPAIPEVELAYRRARTSLRTGFAIGAILLLAGLALTLLRGEELAHTLDPLDEILPALRSGSGAALVDLAILTFLLTPAATVGVVAFSFWQAGDRRYAAIALTVLLILVFSIAIKLVA